MCRFAFSLALRWGEFDRYDFLSSIYGPNNIMENCVCGVTKAQDSWETGRVTKAG